MNISFINYYIIITYFITYFITHYIIIEYYYHNYFITYFITHYIIIEYYYHNYFITYFIEYYYHNYFITYYNTTTTPDKTYQHISEFTVISRKRRTTLLNIITYFEIFYIFTGHDKTKRFALVFTRNAIGKKRNEG